MRRESYPRGSTLKRGSEVDESINHLYPALAVAASIGSIGPFYYLSETLRINDIEVFKVRLILLLHPYSFLICKFRNG